MGKPDAVTRVPCLWKIHNGAAVASAVNAEDQVSLRNYPINALRSAPCFKLRRRND